MIKKEDIKLIDGALEERYWTRLQVYFGGDKNKILPLPTKTLKMYDQGKNPFCTAFACATNLSYNTNREFTNEEIDNWSKKNIREGGSIPSATVNRFCEDFNCRKVQVRYEDAFDFLKVGYAVMINISAPREFFSDGINDGVIDGNYDKDKKMSHEINATWRDGRYYLINSWNNYHEQGLHNQYKIKPEQLEEVLKNRICFILY